MLIRLTEGTLEVANTGAALTAAGVSSASTLRASAKRTAGTVGHFGVGFAATLSVSAAPELISRNGGVRWSRALTRETVAAIPSLAQELSERDGQVPVLRLPYPSDEVRIPDGFDTLVRLPLDEGALPLAVRLLEDLDPTLLLVLPALAEVTVRIELPGQRSERTFTCRWGGADAVLDGERWTGASRVGRVDPRLLATRGVEEQRRDTFEVRVLLPEGEWPERVPRVLRAPQPTDEPLSLPAFVVATVPVDPGRRRIVPGPLADAMLAEVAAALTALAERTGDLRLVPTGLPAGPVDASICDALREALPQARMLPGELRGADALVLDLGSASDPVTEILGDDLPALLPVRYNGPRWAAARRVLGVGELGAGELVTLLAGLARPPEWWAALYPALQPVTDRDALAALPVPLADGRTVTGPRGVLLPGPGLDASALAELSLRLADPAVSSGAAGELLRGLGAVDADPATLLADPAVTEDDVPYTAALALVAALAPAFEGVPADLAERLLLPGADGDLWPAGELLLPGGALARVVRPDAPFGELAADVAGAYDAAVLTAAGVLDTFSVLRAEEVMVDPDDPVLLELDGSDRWVSELGESADAGPVLADFRAVRDLELVRWPEALTVLADSQLRADVLASPYTRWWLRTHPVLPGGLTPTQTALPGELEALYDPAPDGLDPAFLSALGVRESVAQLHDPVELYDVLDRIGDARRELSWRQARALYLAVCTALEPFPADEEPPEFVRTPAGVVPADRAAVVDRPDLLQLLGNRAPVRVPAEHAPAVARMLGTALASSLADFEVLSDSPLTVRDADGVAQRVSWFGTRHDGTPDAQARSLAWTGGRWGERHAIAAALREPQLRQALEAEADLDG
ncbi:MAG TPA: molecular chaperone Hsp90 [Frankiaceae bacterium]|nr:molecular chaperone Hsp90 [Frankiaceae bacterium]